MSSYQRHGSLVIGTSRVPALKNGHTIKSKMPAYFSDVYGNKGQTAVSEVYLRNNERQ